ncbi:phage head closure protein [Jannaschia donghaensis]|uniref:Putative phage head-tail adaptor n=1 Tax=Jannaschia donghaensis TaxID=420998 RepID=A0A0M6YM40_9RHOB|nr:phage head closure protein [Jannaschia donghaensis]CTQ50909.1 putative phage head-tail adaptor [Jannaschia donghaensis]
MGHVFRRRLTLQAPVRVSDGAGGQTLSWEDRGGLWAEVRMRSGSLRHGAFGRTPRLQVRLTTHSVPQGHPMRAEPGQRLRDGGQVYEIEAVHDADDRQLLTILASVASHVGGAA